MDKELRANEYVEKELERQKGLRTRWNQYMRAHSGDFIGAIWEAFNDSNFNVLEWKFEKLKRNKSIHKDEVFLLAQIYADQLFNFTTATRMFPAYKTNKASYKRLGNLISKTLEKYYKEALGQF